MKSSIVILCLLGDPSLPAASCDRTGGFNVDMAEILKYWASFPYSITVITNDSFYAPEKHEQLYKNIHVYRVSLEDNIMNDQPKLAERFPRVLRETTECLERLKIHPVFFHSYYWYSGLLALKLSKKYNVPFIHSIVALSIDKKTSNSPNFCSVQYEFETNFFPYASFLMAISNAEKQTLLKYYGCRAESIIVVGRSVDRTFFFPDHDNRGISKSLLQNNEQKWTLYLKEQIPDSWWYHGAFTYIGRIKYEKGVGAIIEAWYQLCLKYHKKIPPLWIVGGQPDTIAPLRDNFIELYPDFLTLEKEMKICWWGYLTPSSINAVLLKTTAVVTHSQYEAGGRVIIESLSAGKPVIATPTGFAADLVRDWKNGFLVPFGDVELLKRRMEHFIKQPLIANPLGEYARYTFQKAAENWHYYEKHRAIYEHLYNAHSEAPNLCEEENDIFRLIPDFYDKKLLYSWPDSKEIEKQLIVWCREIWDDGSLIIKYRPELSHHSFLWTVKIRDKEYYIKHLYTRFNDHVLWDTNSPFSDMLQVSELYDTALAYSASSLDILAKNEQLFSYITEKAERLPDEFFLLHYKSILRVIYQFDRSFPEGQPSYQIRKYTYEQMFKSIFDDTDVFLEAFNHIRDILTEEEHAELSASYGKNFFSHVFHTEDGYRLLPSASVFWGPAGMDAAVFLLEILNKFNSIMTPERFSALLNDAAEIFHVSGLKIYSLCVAIILLKSKERQCMQNSSDTQVNPEFWKSVRNQFPKSK